MNSVMQQENKTLSYFETTVLHRRERLPIKKNPNRRLFGIDQKKNIQMKYDS